MAGSLVLAEPGLRQAPAAESGRISIDYPADGSIFPPEFPSPTFIWREHEPAVSAWLVEVLFSDGGAPIRLKTSGERLSVGEIDPACIAPTNELPSLTPEQRASRTWTPDSGTWQTIKRHSRKKVATIKISGLRSADSELAISTGTVTIRTSKDPVGAPIFYRDVPLMPSELQKGVIKPLAQKALPLIAWRLRDVADQRSRLLIDGIHTCANCHSFSRDGKTLGMDMDGPQNDKGLYALAAIKPRMSIGHSDVIKWSTHRGKLGGRLRTAFMSQVSPDGSSVITTINDPGTESRERAGDLQGKYYVSNFKDYRFLQVFYPTRGILAWYNRATGKLQPLPGADDPEFVQTDGVWSPDGKHIVFARANARDPYPENGQMAEYANDPNETQIQYDLYRIPFNGGKGGRPERIEGASENGMSNNFPKVSPDGRWVVFVQCRNGQLMRPDSQLYIVPFKGGTARRMTCNTSLMNSWHSFSPNGRWMVFSSKVRSPYTQMYLTHIDEKGMDSPPILVEKATAANRAVNIPEFLNIPADGLMKIESPVTDFYRVCDEAYELAVAKQYDKAIPAWRKALELTPDDSKAHYNLGVALAETRLAEEAIGHFQRALELDPDYSDAHTNLGVILAGTGKLDEAIGHLKKAVELSPRDVKAHVNLAGALADTGLLEEAMAYCRKALEVDPESPDAHNNLGIALIRSGRLDEAVTHLQRAARADPKSLEYQHNLGRVLVATRRFAEAIPHLEKISGVQDPEMLALLVGAYGEVGRMKEAAETARRALDLAIQQNNQRIADALREWIAGYEARK